MREIHQQERSIRESLKERCQVIVAQDGSGDFRTIQEAIDQVPQDNRERVVIHVKPGAYYEKLHIDKKMVTLIGEPGQTVVTYDDCAVKRWPNGQKYGTFHSYSVLVSGDDFTAEGITFENSAGPGAVAGQALAVYIDADRVVFRCCRFWGIKTLFSQRPCRRRQGREAASTVRGKILSGEWAGTISRTASSPAMWISFSARPPQSSVSAKSSPTTATLDISPPPRLLRREIRLCVHQLPAYRRGAA